MKIHLLSPVMTLLLAVSSPALAQAQAPAQSATLAGAWELVTTLKGMPMGGGTRTRKACLAAEKLAAAP